MQSAHSFWYSTGYHSNTDTWTSGCSTAHGPSDGYQTVLICGWLSVQLIAPAQWVCLPSAKLPLVALWVHGQEPLWPIHLLAGGPKKLKCCHSCQKVLRKLCGTSSIARKMLLRFLLEGALSPDHAPAFGAKIADHGGTVESQLQSAKPCLLASSEKQGTGLGLMRGQTTVFHAGVIGQGLKPPPRKSPFTQVSFSAMEVWSFVFSSCSVPCFPSFFLGLRHRCFNGFPLICYAQEEKIHNRQIFISTLTMCSHYGDLPSQSPSKDVAMEVTSSGVSVDVTEVIAKLMVELVTPDVMYNAIVPWPDEDFMKITVERLVCF